MHKHDKNDQLMFRLIGKFEEIHTTRARAGQTMTISGLGTAIVTRKTAKWYAVHLVHQTNLTIHDFLLVLQCDILQCDICLLANHSLTVAEHIKIHLGIFERCLYIISKNKLIVQYYLLRIFTVSFVGDAKYTDFFCLPLKNYAFHTPTKTHTHTQKEVLKLQNSNDTWMHCGTFFLWCVIWSGGDWSDWSHSKMITMTAFSLLLYSSTLAPKCKWIWMRFFSFFLHTKQISSKWLCFWIFAIPYSVTN